jgi:TRAP-type C4-dicarboxylate transport system substrate-binding protein
MPNAKNLMRFSFALAAVAIASATHAQTVLKFSHTDQQQGARHAAAQVFARKVEDYTQGRYKVQVFCCSQLGNDPKNIEQLARSAALTSPSRPPARTPRTFLRST